MSFAYMMRVGPWTRYERGEPRLPLASPIGYEKDMNSIPPITAPSERLKSLAIDPGKPLIICDADEVLVEFAKPLETFLADRALTIDFKSFALVGNIRKAADNSIVEAEEVGHLIDEFLSHVVDRPRAVPDSIHAITHLRKQARVLILTNIPHHLRHRREQAMASIGLDLPVFSNRGEKGPMVAEIARDHQAPVVFLDDLPGHHSSVARHARHVHRIHFVADHRLAKLISPAEDCHMRTDRWTDCMDHIETHFLNNRTSVL